MPISVTLSGGSWLGFEPFSWQAPHVPPVSLTASRDGPWGAQTAPILLRECGSCWAQGGMGLLLQLLEVPEVHRWLGAPLRSPW